MSEVPRQRGPQLFVPKGEAVSAVTVEEEKRLNGFFACDQPEAGKEGLTGWLEAIGVTITQAAEALGCDRSQGRRIRWTPKTFEKPYI